MKTKKRLYFIPGIMCNEMLWSKLFDYFDSSEYELVHLDIPLESSFDAIVDTLANSLQEEKLSLVGFSLGGYIASYFAVKYPHRVKELCVIGSSPCSLPQEEVKKREQAITFVQKNGLHGLSRQKVCSLLSQENQNNKEIITLIQKMYVDLGEEVFYPQMTATLRRDDLFETIGKTTIPILFVYAHNDRLIDTSWMEKLVLVQNKYICINTLDDSTSHMLPLEKPKQLSGVIMNWLDKNDTFI